MPRDFGIHIRAHAQPRGDAACGLVIILGGQRWSGDEMSFTVIDQIIKQKFRGFLHHGISSRCEELAVAREVVVIP